MVLRPCAVLASLQSAISPLSISESNRLILRDLNYSRFGRLIAVHVNGNPPRRRASIIRYGRFVMNTDEALADHALFANHRSIQALIDKYHNSFRIYPCLIPLNSSHLLPPTRSYDYGHNRHEHPDNHSHSTTYPS